MKSRVRCSKFTARRLPPSSQTTLKSRAICERSLLTLLVTYTCTVPRSLQSRTHTSGPIRRVPVRWSVRVQLSCTLPPRTGAEELYTLIEVSSPGCFAGRGNFLPLAFFRELSGALWIEIYLFRDYFSLVSPDFCVSPDFWRSNKHILDPRAVRATEGRTYAQINCVFVPKGWQTICECKDELTRSFPKKEGGQIWRVFWQPGQHVQPGQLEHLDHRLAPEL